MLLHTGDFLLARACVSLARLRSVEVVELLASVIEHLVKGEVMQMSAAFAKRDTAAAFEMYMSKTYYKTASLMANSCKASAMLACVSEEHQEAAFLYGKHIGLAFQVRPAPIVPSHVALNPCPHRAPPPPGPVLRRASLAKLVDDLLDFESTQDALGKPTLNDLQQVGRGYRNACQRFAPTSRAVALYDRWTLWTTNRAWRLRRCCSRAGSSRR